MKPKIVHIINSFEFGGAEVMLGNLLACTGRGRFEPVVVSLIDDLRLADGILASGIPVRVVGMRPGVLDPLAVARLACLLRRERPRVIQTWMDHSNFIGGIAMRLALRAVLVWGVHHSQHVRGVTKRTTLMTVSACARLSRRLPARIVCCSEQARSEYARRGFAAEKLVVIPNGFDTAAFRPDPAARARVRGELGLGPEATLIGLVARYDPVKDHPNFLRAAALLRGRVPGVHFLLCGDKVDRGNAALTSAVESLGLRDRCHLLGPRRDIARIQASLDLATSSSVSEAFPLCLGEAMACGVPCVATDVGDSAAILGETGRVVPPRAPAALADAWEELLGLDPDARARLGLAARRRIRRRYDLASVAERYEDLYEHLLAGEPGSGGPPIDHRDPVSERAPLAPRSRDLTPRNRSPRSAENSS
jgi:glycosyltransferase involved in cell wall biosynthesis